MSNIVVFVNLEFFHLYIVIFQGLQVQNALKYFVSMKSKQILGALVVTLRKRKSKHMEAENSCSWLPPAQSSRPILASFFVSCLFPSFCLSGLNHHLAPYCLFYQVWITLPTFQTLLSSFSFPISSQDHSYPIWLTLLCSVPTFRPPLFILHRPCSHWPLHVRELSGWLQ